MNIALIGYEANIKNRVGSNQYAFELMKALYELDKKNQYVVYLPTQPLQDLPKERKNWHYRVVGPPRFWNIFGLPRALFKQQPKPDVVFNPGHYSPLFFPGSLVVSVMDLGYLRYPDQFTKRILAKLKFLTWISIRRASRILAISEFTRNDIIKTYKINPEKVTTTLLGYDHEKFKIMPAKPSMLDRVGKSSKLKVEEVKKKYKIEGSYLLFLGTLKPNKNIEGLLEAFKKLENCNPSASGSKLKLVIAGREGWLYEAIYEKVKKLGLEERVVFAGFIEEKEKPALMAGADVFCLVSFWEGFGIPVLEAMALGTPTVVSSVASLPEVVGEAGVLVDPYSSKSIAEGIEKAIKNKREFVKKGFERSGQFSWQKCARETLKALEKTLKKPCYQRCR